MNLRELRDLLNTEPASNNELEVKVWLPGSKISLQSGGTLIRQGILLMIEGNIDPGSALDF